MDLQVGQMLDLIHDRISKQPEDIVRNSAMRRVAQLRRQLDHLAGLEVKLPLVNPQKSSGTPSGQPKKPEVVKEDAEVAVKTARSRRKPATADKRPTKKL
jgi:hypothetical protein